MDSSLSSGSNPASAFSDWVVSPPCGMEIGPEKLGGWALGEVPAFRGEANLR